jgi:DMSO/TMAO reductase YedYZ molybdopterin-dependent catalytic subunit
MDENARGIIAGGGTAWFGGHSQLTGMRLKRSSDTMGISRLFGRQSDSAANERLADGSPRLPPGQYLTGKWPILTHEAIPTFDPQTYRFRIWGAVEEPLDLSWDELQALPRVQLTADFHCVTTWSRYNNAWEGVSIRELLARVKPKPEAKFVMAHSWSDYTTNMPLADLDDDDTLVAFLHDGAEIERAHGGPVRLIVPKLYAYKSAKWLNGLEFLTEDQPGFWEQLGYHNHADPWKEERFW